MRLRQPYAYPLPHTIMAFVEKGLRQIHEELGDKVRSRIVGIGIATPFELWNWYEQVGAPEVADTHHPDALALGCFTPSSKQAVRAPENLNQAANVVHGALQHYDLPDLIELAGADKTTIEEPLDAVGEPLQDKDE